jgi:hypothetical protein
MSAKGEIFPCSDGRYAWLSSDKGRNDNIRIRNGIVTFRFCTKCQTWKEIALFHPKYRDTTSFERLREVGEFKKDGKTLILGFSRLCKHCHCEFQAERMEQKRRASGKKPRQTIEMMIKRVGGVKALECTDCHKDIPVRECVQSHLKSGKRAILRVCRPCFNLRGFKWRSVRYARKVYPPDSKVFDDIKNATGVDSLKAVCELWNIHPYRKFQTAEGREVQRKLSRLRQRQEWFARKASRAQEIQEGKEGFSGSHAVPMLDLQEIQVRDGVLEAQVA